MSAHRKDHRSSHLTINISVCQHFSFSNLLLVAVICCRISSSALVVIVDGVFVFVFVFVV
jgi:hypothetical protein